MKGTGFYNASSGSNLMSRNPQIAFGEYLKMHSDAYDGDSKYDQNLYDMRQRLRLAKKVVKDDGNRIVVDLGSYYGGMSRALEEYGARAVSTEIRAHRCRNIMKHGAGKEVVRCDSFRPPLRRVDALVSYMFLGMNVPPRLGEGEHSLSEIFMELFKTGAGTIYSVELKSEYVRWFKNGGFSTGKIICADPSDTTMIKERLEADLPDFEVEYLGEFGEWHELGITDGRIGFKFTRKKGMMARAPEKGTVLSHILRLFRSR